MRVDTCSEHKRQDAEPFVKTVERLNDCIQSIKGEAFKEGYVARGNEFISALLTMPERIKGATLTVADISEMLNQKREEAMKIRSRVQVAIVNEMGAENKLRYTNDRARDAARDIALENNQEYQQLIEAIKNGEKSLSVARIELEFLNNKFEAYRSIASIVAGGEA